MNPKQRGNVALIALVAAIAIPKLQQCCHITLTDADVGDLFALGALAWHAISTTLERYFPPPAPSTAPKLSGTDLAAIARVVVAEVQKSAPAGAPASPFQLPAMPASTGVKP